MTTSSKATTRKPAAKSTSKAKPQTRKVTPKASQTQPESVQLFLSKRVWPD